VFSHRFQVTPPSLIDAERTYSGFADGCAAAGKERCKLVELVGDDANGNRIKRLINDGVDVRLSLLWNWLTALIDFHTGGSEIISYRS